MTISDPEPEVRIATFNDALTPEDFDRIVGQMFAEKDRTMPDAERLRLQATVVESLKKSGADSITIGYISGLELRILSLEQEVEILKAKVEGRKPPKRRKVVKIGDW